MRCAACLLSALLLAVPLALAVPAASAAPPQLTIRTTLDRPVPAGGTVTSAERLVFRVAGDGWLYVLEEGEGRLSVVHPRPGDAQPATEGATSEAWEPRAQGPLEYLLVSSPSPRDAAASPSSLEEFLAPPPYVEGPMGEPAAVVARVAVTVRAPEEAPEGTPE